jgi:hypothetical protein
VKWQEAVLSGGQVAFAILLLPTLFDPSARVPLASSIPTALILAAFVPAFASTGMKRAAWTSAASCLTWLAVAIWRHA